MQCQQHVQRPRRERAWHARHGALPALALPCGMQLCRGSSDISLQLASSSQTQTQSRATCIFKSHSNPGPLQTELLEVQSQGLLAQASQEKLRRDARLADKAVAEQASAGGGGGGWVG